MRRRHGRDRFHTVPIFSSVRNDFMEGNMEIRAHRAYLPTPSRTSSGNVWDADGTRPYRTLERITRSSRDNAYVLWPQKRNLLSLVSATGFQHSCAPPKP